MANQNQADTAPVKETQDSAMPTEEQKTPSSQDSSEVVSQTAEVPSKDTQDEVLPNDVSDRTKREFEKLKSNLREERMRRERLEQMFQSSKQEAQLPPVYDPSTGMLNEQALTDIQKKTYEAEQRAIRAEQSIAKYHEVQEEQEAYRVHPELNPEAKEFDQDLHVLTRSVLLQSMVKPEDFGGKELSFKQAGDFAKQMTTKIAGKAKQAGAKEALSELAPKEQAALEATGSPTRRTEALSNLDDLRTRTRKGDVNAIIERLKNT